MSSMRNTRIFPSAGPGNSDEPHRRYDVRQHHSPKYKYSLSAWLPHPLRASETELDRAATSGVQTPSYRLPSNNRFVAHQALQTFSGMPAYSMCASRVGVTERMGVAIC